MAADDETDRWLHELTVDDAARRRTERNDLRLLEAEAASLVDALVNMTMEGSTVALRVAGTVRIGVVTEVGDDLVELAVDEGRLLVRPAAIDSAEPGPPAAPRPRGPSRSSIGWAERLRLMQGEGRGVTLTLRDGATMTGRLDTVGADVVVLDRRPTQPSAYVALRSLALVLVSG